MQPAMQTTVPSGQMTVPLDKMTVPHNHATILLAAAEAMAETVAPSATIFTDAGLPGDFIEQLRLAAQQFRDSLGGQRRFHDRRSSTIARSPRTSQGPSGRMSTRGRAI